MNRTTLVVCAALGLALAAGAARADVSFDFAITGNANVPTMFLTNTSTAGERITGMTLTIGDTAFEWDQTLNESGPLSWTLIVPDHANGLIKADFIEYDFSGFEAGETFTFDGDIDPDGAGEPTAGNFWEVLFDVDGDADSANAVVTVEFEHFADLSVQLPDFPRDPQNFYEVSSGTLVIPTPSAMAGGLAMLGAMVLRRRR